jgi:hypothetical protein
MKNLKLLLLFLAISTLELHAQNLTLDKINKVYIRSIGSILSGKEISGYYFFYKLENQDKKTALFKLVITDANLNQVAEKEIVDDKYKFISDASFNGENLVFKFLESFKSKEPTITIRKYDTKAVEISKTNQPFEPKAYTLSGMMMTSGDDDEIESSELQPIPGVGFLNFTPVMTKGDGDSKGGMFGSAPKLGDRVGLTINMIGDKGGPAKTWTYRTKGEIIETATYLGSNDNSSFMSMVRREKLTDKTFDFTIFSINHLTGKVNFDKTFTDSKYNLVVSNYVFVPETNDDLVFGTLMTKDVKITKAQTEGLFVAKLDNTGKVVWKNDILWSEFAKQFKPKDEKGNPEDIGNVYIHKIVTTNDGKIFAIGERFRKAASGAGIAMAVLSGGPSGVSVVKAVLEEMVIIEFNKDFKPVSMNFYPKGKKSVQLPSGVGFMSEGMIGMYIKAMGDFQYSFTQERDDKTSFSVGYFYKEEKTNYFGSLSYTDGKFVKDKISLKTESTALRVYPAKPGYIMINEYFKKEKKFESRLEKINF